MKKIYLILSVFAVVFAVVFTACETDFDVNAEWKETTVVYGLLDAGDEKKDQYFKINKAFLGKMDALQMAQYADSVNFNPSNMEVKIYRLKFGNKIDSVILDTTLFIKDSLDVNGDPGIFSTENNIIYTFENNNFLNSNSEYELLIENKLTGNVVTGNTELISDFYFDLNPNYKFGFYNSALADTAKYLSKLLRWDHFTNGKIYQVDIIFDYLENGESKNLIWSQPLVTSEGSIMNTLLEGRKFFTFLSNNIDTSAKVRVFENLTLIMTVGTADLETYINVNRPITGIVQERPQFTNINNGIGIFSSRLTHVRSDVSLTDWTKDYLIEELDRNFE